MVIVNEQKGAVNGVSETAPKNAPAVAVCADGTLIPLTPEQYADNVYERGTPLSKQLQRDDIAFVASASVADQWKTRAEVLAYLAARKTEVENEGPFFSLDVERIGRMSADQLRHRLNSAAERAESAGRRFATALAKVRDTNPQFAAKLEALPADLTGYNLAPLFEEIDGGDEYTALECLEKSWMPTLTNLGEDYNGPIGALGGRFFQNVEKWHYAKRLAEVEAEAAFKAAIERDVKIMAMGRGLPIVRAAADLSQIIFGTESGTEEENQSPFIYLEPNEMAASLAALRLIRLAADEALELAREGLHFHLEEAQSVAHEWSSLSAVGLLPTEVEAA